MKIFEVEVVNEFATKDTGRIIGLYNVKHSEGTSFVTRNGEEILLLVAWLSGWKLEKPTRIFIDLFIKHRKGS